MSRKPTREVDALFKASAVTSELKSSQFDFHVSSKSDMNVKRLHKIFTSWFNSFVSSEGGVVGDLHQDLADGQILGIFISKITGEEVDTVAAVSEKSIKHNFLQVSKVLEKIGISSEHWTIEGIMARDISSILYLLVEMAHKLDCPHRLPSDLSIAVVHTETIGATKKTKTLVFKLTGDESAYGSSNTKGSLGNFMSMTSLKEATSKSALNGSNNNLSQQGPDVIDTLFLPGREAELAQTVQLTTSFINRNLEQIDGNVTDLEHQMHDGVYLIALIGTLGNFFVPLERFKLQPKTTEHKLDNVMFAFRLLESMDIKSNKWNAVDVVKKEPKMILRVIVDIFEAFQRPKSI